MELIIIVAVAQNGVIGKEGGIPWHSKEELKHFKETTMGSPIIMGRKTFESIGKPLKGRKNIIITRNKNYNINRQDVSVYGNLQDAVNWCKTNENEKAFIIGGAQIYQEALTLTDTVLITKMKFTADGDTYFPDINENNWDIDKIKETEEFEVYSYRRKK